jgi:hypothetical protein
VATRSAAEHLGIPFRERGDGGQGKLGY